MRQEHLLGRGVGGGLVAVADHDGQHAEKAADLFDLVAPGLQVLRVDAGHGLAHELGVAVEQHHAAGVLGAGVLHFDPLLELLVLVRAERAVHAVDAGWPHAFGMQAGMAFFGADAQADGLARQVEHIHTQHAIPAGAGQVPDGFLREIAGLAGLAAHLVDHGPVIMLHLGNAAGVQQDQLGDLWRAAADLHHVLEGVGAPGQQRMQHHGLAELERGLESVGRAVQQVIQRVIGGRLARRVAADG